MTYREYLLQQFNCAINAVLGDLAEDDVLDERLDSKDVINDSLIDEISNKVKFYID